jgi:hypothetical protein
LIQKQNEKRWSAILAFYQGEGRHRNDVEGGPNLTILDYVQLSKFKGSKRTQKKMMWNTIKKRQGHMDIRTFSYTPHGIAVMIQENTYINN